MKTYSKTLDPKDYELFDEHVHVNNMTSVLARTPARFEHPHRRWEYGVCLNALRKVGAKDVLDVGGGGSIFAPSAAWHDIGMNVTQIDPGDFGLWVAQQQQLLDQNKAPGKIDYIQERFENYKSKQKYDAVVCLSVLEHIDKDIARGFFKKLLSFVRKGGLIFVTVDYHQSGEAQVDGHLRTYSNDDMLLLAEIARKEGFEWYGGDPDYADHGQQVNQYNFASLCMEKIG